MSQCAEKLCAPVSDGRRSGRIRFLDALKATGIVMVVAVHVLTRVELSGSDRELMMYLVGTIAVPLFFVADGYLFSLKFTEATQFHYRFFISKSAMRLLVPWASFTVLYAGIRLVLEWLKLTRETVLIGNDLSGIMQVIYLSGISSHMYFLLSLFFVRLGTIGFQKSLRWPAWVWLTTSLIYMGAYHLIDMKQWFLPGADPILLACWGVQFYFLGIALQKGLSNIRLYALPVLVLLVGATLCTRLMAIDSHPYISQAFYLASACITLLVITNKTNWSFSMGKDTMGIYLVHAPFIVWGTAVFVTSLLAAFPIIGFAVTTAMSVLLSWLIARLMSNSLGGRLLLGGGTVPIQERS